MIQLPPLLYAVAEECDGRSSYADVAERVTERVGRGVSPDNVRLLVEERLRPIGVLAQADGSTPRLAKLDPLLALRFRFPMVPARVARAVAAAFAPLFFPPVVVAVVGALLALDAWYFLVHGVAQSTRTLLYNPIWMLVVAGLVVVGTAWHEVGHAAALRYGGGRPGVMGAGIYIVWPAFYTDVTDAYRLSRRGRIRTDLGGVYFNAIFMLGIGAVYFVTGLEPLLVALLVIHLQVIQQFLPFLRLDGYYLVSDLTGVPDLFARIRPTLKSLLPGQDADPAAAQLKPWVRKVTTAWVLAMVPVIALVFAFLVFNAPRMFATGWDSFWVQGDRLASAYAEGNLLRGSYGLLQTIFLVLPLAGITYTSAMLGWRLTNGAWSWSADSGLRRGGVVLVAGGLAAVGAWVLLPNGDYTPIQPGERGTLASGVRQLGAIDTGRPSFTTEREQELGEIVRVRDGGGDVPVRPQEEPTPDGSRGGDAEDGGTPTVPAPSATTGGAETAPGSTEPAETTPATTAPADEPPATQPAETGTETAPTTTTATTSTTP